MVSEFVTAKINIISKNCLQYLSLPSAGTHTHIVLLFIVTTYRRLGRKEPNGLDLNLTSLTSARVWILFITIWIMYFVIFSHKNVNWIHAKVRVENSACLLL